MSLKTQPQEQWMNSGGCYTPIFGLPKSNWNNANNRSHGRGGCQAGKIPPPHILPTKII